MKKAIPEMEVYTVDEGNRRTKGGQYHADDLVELYLAFGGRKEKVDTRERLADEFTRLDFIEATENKNFSDEFYKSLSWLTNIDIAFSRFQNDNLTLRFNIGRDLFKSQPAKVGFITAVAKRIYGRPGIEKTFEEIERGASNIGQTTSKLVEKLLAMNNDELGSFLSLHTLSEKLSVKSSRVGDFEREFFTKSFETLFEIGHEIPSLEVCWQSY